MAKPLVRFALFITCLLISLISLLFIAFLIWIRYDVNFEYYLRRAIVDEITVTSNVYNSVLVSFWVLLGMATASLIVCAYSAVATIIGRKWMLWTCFFLILILSLIELGIAIFIAVIQKNILPEIDRFLSKIYEGNVDLMRALEDRFQCCGNTQYYAHCPTIFRFIDMNCTGKIWELTNRVLIGTGISTLIIVFVEFITSAGHLYTAVHAKSDY